MLFKDGSKGNELKIINMTAKLSVESNKNAKIVQFLFLQISYEKNPKAFPCIFNDQDC